MKNNYYEEETMYNIESFSGKKFVRMNSLKKTKTKFPNINAKVPTAAGSLNTATTSEVELNERMAKVNTQNSERLKILDKRKGNA